LDAGVNNEASSDPLEGTKVISLVLDLLSEATERLEVAFEEADHMFRPNSDLIQNEEGCTRQKNETCV
jgi:hypothetical protein